MRCGKKVKDLLVPQWQYSHEVLKSPNYSQGIVINPQIIVLHHSAGTWEGDTSWIMNPQSNVSYHCLINLDGSRRQFVAWSGKAWHAGHSSWKGREYCNSFSVGISFTGNTYTGKYRNNNKVLTDDEVESAVEIINFLEGKFNIDDVVSHREISPDRKNDPSPGAMNQVLSKL